MFKAGIDLSLSSPAISVFDTTNSQYGFSNVEFYNLTTLKKCLNFDRKLYDNLNIELFPKTYESQEHRYQFISDWVIKICDSFKIDEVFIEGYSFGSTGRSVFQIAENAGNLKMELFRKQISFQMIPPTEVKKYATKKGNANKTLMELSFIAETGLELRPILNLTEKQDNPISDLIDSYYILKCGLKR